MTWNGNQGFQTPIQNDSFIVEGVGALGTAHTERGLTYFEVELSGHMSVPPSLFSPTIHLIRDVRVPQYSPQASLFCLMP
jgi:hypothetical protein